MLSLILFVSSNEDVNLLIKQLKKLDLSLPLNIIGETKDAKFNILNIIYFINICFVISCEKMLFWLIKYYMSYFLI